jgi:hypothetical protein
MSQTNMIVLFIIKTFKAKNIRCLHHAANPYNHTHVLDEKINLERSNDLPTYFLMEDTNI